MNRSLQRQKLLNVDVETLVDSLIELTKYSDEADDLVERLISTKKENLISFKKKLYDLKNSLHFVGWRESASFSRELSRLLDRLKSDVCDPMIGIENIVAFFEADILIFERCDDSSGHIGDVFRYDAKELFVEFASKCAHKKKIAELLLEILERDGYGVRDSLLDSAVEYLPESTIRFMITILQKRSCDANDEYRKRYHLRLVESLARQIKDAKLFEETRIASWEKLSSTAILDIATVYFESEDIVAAQEWIKQIPDNEVHNAHDRDELLLEIYKKQGDSESLKKLLFQKFKEHPSSHTLEPFLDEIGHEQRESVIDAEVKVILKNKLFSYSNADFLIHVGKVDQAEAYLLNKIDQIDGEFYNFLLPLAKSMEEDNRYFMASLIYRSLLMSILGRAYTKSYTHGVSYLKKLDKFEGLVLDWRNFPSHENFKNVVLQTHGRKKSFWAKNEK